MDRGRLHPHFVKRGDGHFEDIGPFDGDIRYNHTKKVSVMLLKGMIVLPDTRWLLVHSILWHLTVMSHYSQGP